MEEISDNKQLDGVKYHVLYELKRLSENIESINKKIDELKKNIHSENEKYKVEIAVLKVKTGIIGFIGGAIPASIALLVGQMKF